MHLTEVSMSRKAAEALLILVPREPENVGCWTALFCGPAVFFFLRFYLFIFREGVREGESEGEKPQCVVTSHAPHTGDLT